MTHLLFYLTLAWSGARATLVVPSVPDHVRQQISFIDLEDPVARAGFALNLVLNAPGLRAPTAGVGDRLDLVYDFALAAHRASGGLLEVNRLPDGPVFGARVPGRTGVSDLSLEEISPLTALVRDTLDLSFGGYGPYALLPGARAYVVRASYRTADNPDAFVLTIPVTDDHGTGPLVLTLKVTSAHAFSIAAVYDAIAQLWGADRIMFPHSGPNTTGVTLIDTTLNIIDGLRARSRNGYLAGERVGIHSGRSFPVRTRARGATPPLEFIGLTRSPRPNAYRGMTTFERARIGARLGDFVPVESRVYANARAMLGITNDEVEASRVIDAAEVRPPVRPAALKHAVEILGLTAPDLLNLMSVRTLGRVLKSARDAGEPSSIEWQLLGLLVSQRLARDARRESDWGKHGIADSLRFLARGLPVVPIEPEVRTVAHLRRRLALDLYQDPASALDAWWSAFAHAAHAGLFTEDHLWDALIDHAWSAPAPVILSTLELVLAYPTDLDPAAARRVPRAISNLIRSLPAATLVRGCAIPGCTHPAYGRGVRRAWRRARITSGLWRPVVRRGVTNERTKVRTTCDGELKFGS